MPLELVICKYIPLVEPPDVFPKLAADVDDPLYIFKDNELLATLSQLIHH